MVDPVAAPLILTLAFPADVQARLEALRRAHYPVALNRVPAHLTLFHHLPGPQAPGLVTDLKEIARHHAPPDLRLAGLMSLGRGVAIRVESDALDAVRTDLAERWEPLLLPQDRAPFRPHVTIANKLQPAAARTLLARLSAGFAASRTVATGLDLWRLDGMRWAELVRVRFRHY
ncbi:MAG: 2'-5' RNA ligase family protein [Thermaurantiacus sp.]